MESDGTTTSAADQLRSAERLRQHVERSGPTRASAVLQLWGAIVLPIYVGVFLLSFGPRMSELTTLLLFPVLLFSSLVSGARDRFGIRTRPRGGSWVAQLSVVAAFLVLLALRIGGVSYPWWIDVLVVAAMFVTLAIGPVRQLLAARGGGTTRWSSRPLDPPARGLTVAIGIASGLLVASATEPWNSLVAVVIMLALIVALVLWRTRWGLPRTGFEWGPLHWAAFGVIMTAMFVLTALLSLTEWITALVTVTAGILIAAIMTTVAFLPRDRRG